MMSLIFRLYRSMQYMKLTRRLSNLRTLSKFPKLALSAFEEKEGKIVIRGTNIDATVENRQFLLAGSDLVKKLLEETNASFHSDSNGVLLEVSGVKLRLQYWEELFIATEVFSDGVYNLKMEEPFILIDVGMNVGTTSLFFASKKNCQTVYAFELFPKTFEKASVNLSLNPELAVKIHALSKGLAAGSGSEELEYLEEWKGSVGIFGLPNHIAHGRSAVQKAKVEFLSSEEAFSGIFAKHPNQTVVCKMDCEGAEYEILNNLDQRDLLSKISILIIEWHRKGANPIENLLQKHGFRMVSFSPGASTFGMIYAWRPIIE